MNRMDDLISRQAAIDALEKSRFPGAPYIDTGVQIAMREIKALPSAQPEQRWIPCSERLPEADEYNGDVAKYYLVQNEYGDMLVARYTHSDYWEQIYQLKPISDEIVAWMPLPEPYREESEDKG